MPLTLCLRACIEQIVIPIFYQVDPEDVEELKGDFGKEFSIHEGSSTLRRLLSNFFTNVSGILIWPYWDDLDEQYNNDAEATTNADCVQKWRSALSAVAGLSKYPFAKGENESNFIKEIVKTVSKRLKQKPLQVAEYPVGLASRVDIILHKLNMESSNDVRILGLHGIDGVGKTTTAKALYNKLVSEFEFDGCCFLSKVGERARIQGLDRLQQALLSTITGDKSYFMEYCEEENKMQRILQTMKVLVFLDAVDEAAQLRKLAGELEWFGAGSIIIITTGDLGLLRNDRVKITHEIKELEDSEATQHFSWRAFGKPQPDEDCMELCSRAIRCARGHPLALEMLGSSLYGKSASDQDEALGNLERDANGRIYEIPRVSYNNLKSEEKTIFLDTAFFLRGKPVDAVKKFLDVCGLDAYQGIERLIDRSLVYVDYKQTLEMHELLQVMGTNIARDESSRLCIRQKIDISRQRLGDVEILLLDLWEEEEVALNFLEELEKLRVLEIRNGCFSKMPKKLSSSIRWLKWLKCSVKSIQPGFLPVNLVVLEMPSSSIRRFLRGKSWSFLPKKSKAQKFEYLTRMNFSGCGHLRKIVDFSAVPNLEELDLHGCERLKKVGVSLGSLEKLKKVNLDGCSSLKSLPNLESQCLESINLNRCSSLENLPNLPISLTLLYMSESGIKEIPSSIRNLTKLSQVKASNCKKLLSVSNEIFKLPFIKSLDLSNCPNLSQLPEPEAESSTISSNPTSRVDCWLNLSGNRFVSLLENTFKFIHIKYLILNNCERLINIPKLPRCLLSLEARNCKSLERFPHVEAESFEGDFLNCHKLAMNEKQRWRVMFQNLSQRCLEDNLRREYRIVLPGNQIPEWFRYNFPCDVNMSSFTFQLPQSESNDNLIGIAWCVVFQCSESHDSSFRVEFSVSDFVVQSDLISPQESDHLLLFFCTDVQLPKLLQAEEILCQLHCKRGALIFKKVGLHFIYKT